MSSSCVSCIFACDSRKPRKPERRVAAFHWRKSGFQSVRRDWMSMVYKVPISVLVVIHTPDLQVLLLERADRPGFWQSVTGSQDAGETLAQTAQREVAEETGLDATRYKLTD